MHCRNSHRLSFFHGSLRRIVQIVLIAAAASCGGSRHGGGDEANRRLQTLLEERWNAFAAARPGIRGSLGIEIRSSERRWFAAAGDPFRGGPSVHIRGASTTKTFTAAAVMLLRQEGRLDIDALVTDPIPGRNEPYLPGTPEYAIPFKERISIRQLLEHRAGVFDLMNNDVPPDRPVPYAGGKYTDYVLEILGDEDHTFTFDELASVVAANRLYHDPPGETFHYSDTGYMLLGKIIERVAGRRYHTFINERFVEPLGLSDTAFPYKGTDQNLPEPMLPGYTRYQGRIIPAGPENFSANVAEGNITTIAEDLSHWVRALLQGDAGLDGQSIDMMQAVKPTFESHEFYGLGLVYTEGLGYGHNGGHAGYLTVMRYNPLTDLSVVIFMSIADFDALNDQQTFMYELGRTASGIVLGEGE